MKLKLIRCPICHDWFSPLRSHCPNCGAAEIAPMTFVSVSNTGRLQACGSGLMDMRAAEHVMEIARLAK